MPYFSGQGKVYIGTRQANGAAGTFRHVGNAPGLTVSLETDVLEHKESTSGQRLSDLRLTREKKASMSLTLEEFSATNLAQVLAGTASTIAAGSYTSGSPDVLTGASLPAVGDVLRLARGKVTSLVIKDSTGTPKTLTADVNYRVLSADHGTIEILDITTGGTYTAPLKAEYSYAQQSNVNMFSAGEAEYWLKFDAVNTANANSAVLVELYRVRLDPAQELGLINDDILSFELKGSVLADATKSSDQVLGQFGRVVM